jgi:hypothetical protein
MIPVSMIGILPDQPGCLPHEHQDSYPLTELAVGTIMRSEALDDISLLEYFPFSFWNIQKQIVCYLLFITIQLCVSFVNDNHRSINTLF